jgi:hypothetical protein
MKTSDKLLEKLKALGIVNAGDWEGAYLRTLKHGKHQLADGWWSWEVQFTGMHTEQIGSTSTMLACLMSEKLDVIRVTGGTQIEPSN